MKRNAKAVLIAISVATLIAVVMTVEKKSMTPMERYLETVQTTKQTKKYVPAKIMNDTGNLQYEFISYDLIEDKDIEVQTKYKAEFFTEGKLPPSDYIVKKVDYAAMRRDYPKYDEYMESNGEKGLTDNEAEMFERDHEAEYTTEKHIKTKYLFVRCRITYLGDASAELWLSNFNLFVTAGGKVVGLSNPNCYFDHSQHSTEEDRMKKFFIYSFEKSGDSLECVLGCRLQEDRIDFSEGNKYYVGFQPGTTYSDEDQFNPALDRRCVALDDMPKEE